MLSLAPVEALEALVAPFWAIGLADCPNARLEDGVGRVEVRNTFSGVGLARGHVGVIVGFIVGVIDIYLRVAPAFWPKELIFYSIYIYYDPNLAQSLLGTPPPRVRRAGPIPVLRAYVRRRSPARTSAARLPECPKRQLTVPETVGSR